jgi:hypothetical protein
VPFVTANGASIPVLGFGTYGMARLYMLGMIPATLNAPHRHGTDRPQRGRGRRMRRGFGAEAARRVPDDKGLGRQLSRARLCGVSG